MHQRFCKYFCCFRFRQREWRAAVETYTEAIAGAQFMVERVHLLPILFRNRSSAFFAMKHFVESLDDAKASLQLEPNSAKVDKTKEKKLVLIALSLIRSYILIYLRATTVLDAPCIRCQNSMKH